MAANITQDAIDKAWDRFPNLETVVARRTWPTPNATDGKGASTRSPGKERPACDDDLPTRCGGSLNLDWVELLMGWPEGWTGLSPMPIHGVGMAAWEPGWEDGVPRVAKGVSGRVARLKAVGNGQVPQCAATAWLILGGPA